jgi:hypothetical protein
MKISKISYLVLTVCALMSMTGCQKAIKDEEARLAKIRAEQESKKPIEIKRVDDARELGVYDGCKVTFHIVRGEPNWIPEHRFYIAKCNGDKNTTTTTEVTTEQKMMGRYIQNVEKLSATITEEEGSEPVGSKKSKQGKK